MREELSELQVARLRLFLRQGTREAWGGVGSWQQRMAAEMALGRQSSAKGKGYVASSPPSYCVPAASCSHIGRLPKMEQAE